MITCPLCGEGDFDRIGFLHHIQRGYCDEIAKVQDEALKEAEDYDRRRRGED